MPRPADLPDSIKELSFYNAADVDDGRDFHQHMERVIRSLDATSKGGLHAKSSGLPKTRGLAAGAAATAILLLVGWMFQAQLREQFGRTLSEPTTAPAGPPQVTPTPNPPTSPRLGSRIALVIGNAGYQNVARLSTPGNDATAMAGLFKTAGFDVVEARRDMVGAEFKRTVRDFARAAQSAVTAAIFYAGHGIEVNGTNYLVPVDAKLADVYDVEDEGISLDRIIGALDPVLGLRLIILDACRDNPFLKTMQRTRITRAVSSGLARIEPSSPDTLIAYAAKAGTTADDGTGPNSPYTGALVKHLPVPGLDIRIALGRVRDEVLRNTANRQEPFVYGSLGGSEMALVPK
jgi:hypothetical protein